ncbi:MAG: ABC transporter ATP-binding protein [Alphaproteobacteria bacterium]|nr:ABC transporter ATP-binding protein [Alphaproteobacteria bacterium]
MASIKAENLTKTYGLFPAVRSIEFDIADGEFVAILGPSGCGKSSTMRMIAGLETISGGTILFDGRPVNEIRARDRNVAMSFESYALYSTITVRKNIAFPLDCAGMPRLEIERRVSEIAEKMELTELLDAMPSALSSGQSQRVGLARALVRNPSVFLLDEPISHLDTRQRYRMRRFIKSLHQEYAYTMIYVTHDQEEAMALADRVIVMSDGAIQQIGTPYEIYTKPKNLFVAGFVGEPPMNFLPYEYDHAGETIVIEGQVLGLPEALRADAAMIGPEGLAAVRPGFVSIGVGSSVTLDATVFITEALQDHNLVYADIGDTRVCVETAPEMTPRRGEAVKLAIDPDHLLLFPRDQLASDTEL